MIVAKTGSRSVIDRIPYERAFATGFEDMRHRMPDISKIRALTGFSPKVPVEQIVDAVIGFYRS